EEGNPPSVQLEHRSPGDVHEIRCHLGRFDDAAVGRLVIVISGHVVDLACQRRDPRRCRAQIVLVQAHITDWNGNLYTCGKSGDCSWQAVEGQMHVADERNHLRWSGRSQTKLMAPK